MATLTAVRARLRDILLSVQARLVQHTGLGEDRVRLIARQARDLPHVTGEQDVLIQLLGLQPTDMGAGRIFPRGMRTLRVHCRSICALESHRDDAALLDLEVGLSALEETVCDALEEFFPEKNGNHLVATCLLLASAGPPGRGEPADEEGVAWTSSALDFTFEYARETASGFDYLPKGTKGQGRKGR